MEEWLTGFLELFNHDKMCTECTHNREKPTLRDTREQDPKPSYLIGRVSKRIFPRRNRKKCSFAAFVDFYKKQRRTVVEQAETDFFNAVHENKSYIVHSLIKRGFKPNNDRWSGAVLHIAVTKGFVATTRVLLQHGADANKRDPMGNTPLHLAVRVRYRFEMIQLVRLLIQYNANVNSTDGDGNLPIDIARNQLILFRDGGIAGVRELIEIIRELKQAAEYPQMTQCGTSNDECLECKFMTGAEFANLRISQETCPALEEASGGPDVMNELCNIENWDSE